MTAIGSALHGQAHDGIDSVPTTGTWLLQKGERVVTSKTSAKLDSTLDRVANQGSGGNVYAPQINIPINGNPSDATVNLVKKGVEEAVRRGHAMVVNELSEGKGRVHKALVGGYNTGRRTG